MLKKDDPEKAAAGHPKDCATKEACEKSGYAVISGKRMLKFDFKGYSKARQWVPIGEGDEDWPEILKALAEVGYNGWATAEVGGGGEEWLKKVSAQMDKILGL